jgi:hypothetical protein
MKTSRYDGFGCTSHDSEVARKGMRDTWQEAPTCLTTRMHRAREPAATVTSQEVASFRHTAA